MPNENYLTVRGKRFHYIWLRDHCLCPECRDPSCFQKVIDLSDRTSPPVPKSVELGDEQLIVTWNETPPHRSIFPIYWLLSYAYDPEPDPQPQSETRLWDKVWFDVHPPKWHDFSTWAQQSWMIQILELGFTLLKNMSVEQFEPFVSAIGPIIPIIESELILTVKAIPNPDDLAGSCYALTPHTDLSYMHTQPVVQFLHCLENEATGGESILVDGFRVARDFQKNHPEYFGILSRTPVQFRNFFPQPLAHYFAHTTPILKLDGEGKVTEIYLSHKNFDVNLPFHLIESFYEAYSAFFNYLKNPAYQYCFRLQPGDCLLMQNFRVLHGRKAFDPTSGARHLQGAYLPWEYFVSRWDFPRVKPLYMGK